MNFLAYYFDFAVIRKTETRRDLIHGKLFPVEKQNAFPRLPSSSAPVDDPGFLL
jgi:hypothetical protein